MPKPSKRRPKGSVENSESSSSNDDTSPKRNKDKRKTKSSSKTQTASKNQTSPKTSLISVVNKVLKEKGMSPKPIATSSSYADPYEADKSGWLPKIDVPKVLLDKAVYKTPGKEASVPNLAKPVRFSFTPIGEIRTRRIIDSDSEVSNEKRIGVRHLSSIKDNSVSPSVVRSLVHKTNDMRDRGRKTKIRDAQRALKNPKKSTRDRKIVHSPKAKRHDDRSRKRIRDTKVRDYLELTEQVLHDHERIYKSDKNLVGKRTRDPNYYDKESRSPSRSPQRSPMASSPIRRRTPERNEAKEAKAIDEFHTSLTDTGFIPYHVLVVQESYDAIVFAHTQYNDRVAVFYPKEVSKPAIDRGAFFRRLAHEPVDSMILEEFKDATSIDASTMTESVAQMASSISASSESIIFGSLVASSIIDSIRGEQDNKYVMILYKETKTSKNRYIYVYMQTHVASDASKGPIFDCLALHPTGILPVVHHTNLSNPTAISSEIRNVNYAMETKFTTNERSTTERVFETGIGNIEHLTKIFYNNASNLLKIKESMMMDSLDQFKDSIQNDDTPDTDLHSKNMGVLTDFSSRLVEIIGETSRRIESAITMAEEAYEKAIANMFIEAMATGISVNPKTFDYPDKALLVNPIKIHNEDLVDESGKVLSRETFGSRRVYDNLKRAIVDILMQS